MKMTMNQLHHDVFQGIQAFNQGMYYNAHEYFEDAWRDTPDNSREVYRALLHLSGGYYRLSQDRSQAARKFFIRALTWIETFSSPFLGIDTAAIIAQLQTLIAAIDRGKSSSTLLNEHAFHIPLINHTRSS
jgi:predicted metal-dependent hydrolase